VHVVVLGGGITGLFVSYYLKKDGHDVTLIDKKTETSSTSIYNAGFLTPSFAPSPPLSMLKVASAIFRPSGALCISAGEVAKNPGWFLRAVRTGVGSHERDVMDMGKRSLALYGSFFREEDAKDIDLQQGVIGLYRDEAEARTVAAEVGGDFLDRAEVDALGFRGLGGGVYFRDELSINPPKLVSFLRSSLERMGVRMRSGQEAELKGERGRVERAVFDGLPVEGDVFVVAAGSKSAEVLRPLGYRPRLLPARGLVMMFESAAPGVVGRPALLEDYGIAVVQHNPRTVRVTGFFEMKGFDADFRDERRRWLKEATTKHVVGFEKLRLTEVGVGYRPCTPDQLPLVGRVPAMGNCFVAAGTCRLGMTLAPVAGHLISSLIGDEHETNESLVKLLDPARLK
jgi:D-amino-acid dehydrogenase